MGPSLRAAERLHKVSSVTSARAQEVKYIKHVMWSGGRYRLYRFPEDHLTRVTSECQRCRPSLHLVFIRFPKVSSVIETISQAHFVSVSCCKTVPLKPSNNSSRPAQGCAPPPRRGAAAVPGFDWLPSCHRARSLGVPCSQFKSYGVSLHLFMAQVRGRATEACRGRGER